VTGPGTGSSAGSSTGGRARGAVLAFAAAFVLSVAACEGLVSAAARLLVGGSGESLGATRRAFALSSAGLMACGCLEGLVLLAVAVVAARLEGESPGARLRLLRTHVRGPARVAAVAGLIGLTLGCGAVATLAGAPEGVMDLAASKLTGLGPLGLSAAIVTLAVVPAIGEEALFRGYIQGGLAPAIGRWPAIAVTSAGFGLIHVDAVQGAGAFVAGLFLGWTAERTGSLRLPVAAHALNNVTFVAVAALGAPGRLPARVEVASLAVGALVFGASTLALRASTRAS
jgi:membrane protease YdiL (CAAX protease family)